MDIGSGVLFGLAAMASWGVSDYFVVRPVREAGVSRTFLWNQLTGLPLMLGVFLIFGDFTPLSIDSALLIAGAGACGMLGSIMFYRGMDVGNVSVVTPIVAAWSVVTAIGGVMILGETLGALQTAGIILAVGGTVLVSLRIADIRSASSSELAKGAEHAAAAMALFGFQFIFLDMLSHRIDWLEAIVLTKAFIAAAAIIWFPIAKRGRWAFPEGAYPAIIMIALFEVLGFMAYGGGISMAQSSIVAPVSATHPLVTIALAVVFLRERLEPNQALGVLCVVGGLVMLSL